MIYEIVNVNKASTLFGNWEETLIWSCLQGVMGKIYGDDREQPASAMAILGDFIFYSGKPSLELAAFKPGWCTQNFVIMVPQTQSWQEAITKVYGERAKPAFRYAIKKETDIFDRKKLTQAAASLPETYKISLIDEPLYHMCRAEAWSADLVSQFPDYESYRQLGLGVAVSKDNVILSGASSYSRYLGGIEIEIDTRTEYRRQGLAYACGARLILECLNRNLYPSWDAHNKASVALAEKLGYHYSHTYPTIEIWDY